MGNKISILLVCNLGASTGIMVAKMRTIAEKSEKLKNRELVIDARPAGDLKEYVEKYDCVLVGPQMKHKFNDLKKICDSYNKPIELINTEDYGMADGGKILLQALRVISNSKKDIKKVSE
ncbi:PTS sugar transporter subunit IIB [Clostridium tertium]